jgi:hypothetical protein
MRENYDPQDAKAQILEYCKRKGALAAGVADLSAVERVAPPGHRPSDMMPRVKSVISLGVGGQTQGAWSVPAKALGFFGSTEARAYKIAYGCAFYIEHKFRTRAIYCPPDMDPESGARVPFQSLKLHAELAGIGARSLAGDILLHPLPGEAGRGGKADYPLTVRQRCSGAWVGHVTERRPWSVPEDSRFLICSSP